MTVIFTKKCELGLQAVLFLSVQMEGIIFTAAEISKELNVPQEFVSKVLQKLTENGIVGSKKGKKGGFFLDKAPKDIKLIEIVDALDGRELFNNCVLGFPGCSIKEPCPLHEKWGEVSTDVLKMLSEETLQDMHDKTSHKMKNL